MTILSLGQGRILYGKPTLMTATDTKVLIFCQLLSRGGPPPPPKKKKKKKNNKWESLALLSIVVDFKQERVAHFVPQFYSDAEHEVVMTS